MPLSRPSSPLAFLHGSGQMGELIARHPWGPTSLGPIETWPAHRRTAIATLLRSHVPMTMLWGTAGVMVYNDAYAEFAGARHPSLLGSPVREAWPEVADFNDNVMRVVLGGGNLRYQDQELTLHRRGKPEQVWMNLDYSPVPDDLGAPAAVLAIVIETTAKVRAERRVDGERERLHKMYEQAPGFMALLSGPRHVFELANPAYMQLVGHRPILGKDVRSALPEIAGQGFFELLDGVYESGEAYAGNGMQVTLQRSPGGAAELRYVDLVYQPLRDDHGEVFGIFVQGTDVTDRLVAERAMRESEAQFRAFAQAMPNQVWAAHADGQLYWLNDKVYGYSGMPHAQLVGHGWARMVHGDDLPGAQARWAAALQGGQSYEAEFRLRRADGSYRWHLARALPIREAGGPVTRWIGTNTDIDDQKAAAQALAHLNQTLEQQVAERTADRDRMWRLSTDVMLVADLQGRIVATNPAWTQLLGWPLQELQDRSFLDFVHEDDRAATLAEVARLGEGLLTLKFENRYRRRDGGYCTLSWTAVPDAGFIHAVGRDVTADKEAAAALHRSQAALQQAQKMETIGQLTGGVAHDFNNLLQVIAGNLQLLSRVVAGNERAERLVGNGLAGVSRGARLASQLLAFARRQPLEPRVVNIGRLVAGMEEMLQRTLGDSVEIEVVVSAGLWNTFVDPAQIENALLNLAINARDAMGGVGRLTIDVGNASLDDDYVQHEADVAPGQYVRLAVTDTGSGMPADVAARAFEPFFSTKPEGKGTGLGLSMVYGFAKQSGGHLKIYSEVGHGTTVKMYLPRSMQAEDVIVPLAARPVVGGTETVLVAEDDEDVRRTVVEMLEGLGYRVLKARDAATALAIVESGIHIDVLFTDVVMPGTLRSPELARLAKQRQPHIAVLFTSGYTENAIVHGGRLDAGVELLGKPYTQDALARKLRHVLANEKQREAAGKPAPAPIVTRPPVPAQAQAQAEDRAPGRKVLLLVDDDALVRSSTADMLRSLGHEVLEAAQGSEAMQTLRARPVDVLVTDLHLPGMQGGELARQARQLRADLAIVFATGDSATPAMDNSAVLLKPYDLARIEAVLAAVGSGAGVGTAAADPAAANPGVTG